MCIYKQNEKMKKKHMAVDLQKHKKWAKIASGPS
jgi:hypothetical protein